MKMTFLRIAKSLVGDVTLEPNSIPYHQEVKTMDRIIGLWTSANSQSQLAG